MSNIEINTQSEPHSIQVHEETKKPSSVPKELAVLPLRNLVLLPYNVTSVTVGQPRSLALLEEVLAGNQLLVVVAYKDPKVEQPQPGELYDVGCVAQVLQTGTSEAGPLTVLLQGLDKVRIRKWLDNKPYLNAEVETVSDIEPDDSDIEAQAVRNNLLQMFTRLVSKLSYLPDELIHSLEQTDDYRQLTYLIGSSMRIKVADAQEVLEQEDVLAKMLKLTALVRHEIEVMELGEKIQSQAHGEMEKAQREYVLRHQLKAIRKELGEENGFQITVNEYRKKIEACGMSKEAKEHANLELARLERLPEASSESGLILNYLDWMISLPWREETEDCADISKAREVLDKEHYGLEKVKSRILEYLAVRQLRQKRLDQKELTGGRAGIDKSGVILCFAGPPGIGKTSLGRSIAHALGRKMQRISLGGVRDESEIRGHRRTYIGAMPGRIIKAMKEVATRNPVLLLDEIDKLGSDWQGDPSSAMLEVLDPQQNKDFRDHYLEVPFDLSHAMFIATANQLDSIPGPLRDRMEVISLSGYTDDEKLNIALRYLLPYQRKYNGLKQDELTVSDDAMLRVIQEYTREAGVRNLERQIGAICRKVVVKIAEEKIETLHVEADMLDELLGKPTFFYDVAERTEMPGVATGLAVTSVGGDILFVEASSMPGKKGLTVTGQLGDVMRESVEAALSYVRAHAESLGIDTDFFERRDIHIHLPAGATPKDGPSAGVTLVTALVSLLTGRTVSNHVGMTGEISLRGQVLPVGGIKDKVLAAHRAGLTTVILPKRNEKDLDDLPQSIIEEMRFVLADHVDAVLEVALNRK